MDNKNMLISSLVGAVVMIVLSNVPVISLINCLLCAGVWLGGMAAVWFYRRQTGQILRPGQGAVLGAIAGLIGGIVSAIIGSVVGANMMQEMIAADPSGQMADTLGPLVGGGTTLIVSLLTNLITFPLFGAIGGAIYASLTRPKAPPAI